MVMVMEVYFWASAVLMNVPRSMSISTERAQRSASCRFTKLLTSSGWPWRLTRACQRLPRFLMDAISIPKMGQKWDKPQMQGLRGRPFLDG